MATAIPTHPSAPPMAQASGGLGVVAAVQGLYYLVTGAWPLVHIDSFQAVTGPKADLWLVYTVGALIGVVGLALLNAARAGRVTADIILLAAGAAVALTAIDVIFVARQVIAPIYLADAAAEVVLIAWWAVAAGRGRSPVMPSASR